MGAECPLRVRDYDLVSGSNGLKARTGLMEYRYDTT
jgi:hypothetical protein